MIFFFCRRIFGDSGDEAEIGRRDYFNLRIFFEEESL